MPIVEPLLWLAVACLLAAFIGLLRENIRLKEELKALDWYYTNVQTVHLTETEKA